MQHDARQPEHQHQRQHHTAQHQEGVPHGFQDDRRAAAPRQGRNQESQQEQGFRVVERLDAALKNIPGLPAERHVGQALLHWRDQPGGEDQRQNHQIGRGCDEDVPCAETGPLSGCPAARPDTVDRDRRQR